MRGRSACLLSIQVLALAAAAVAAPSWREKADPWVLERLAGGRPAEFLALLERQADLAPAATIRGKLDKRRWVVERLRAVAEGSQGPILQYLRAAGVAHRAYWIANVVWVRADETVARELALRPDVRRLLANPRVRGIEPLDERPGEVPQGVEPNLTQVGAPDFWAAGFTGQGIVVAGGDTGYQWDHPALKAHYRGWNGASANHNYNWHDATGACPNVPCDPHSHGTHTMGTMVGDDGGSNQIGMAPGARWIGCRNMDPGGNGTPATYTECFQFFIAPTNLAGQNPIPALAPDVINNSWGCPPSEGCTDPTVLESVVEATRAAGIEVVVSAGNSGSSCSSVDTPAAIYEASFTIGAVDSGDNIAGFSSRGPVTVDGSNRRKPDVSAPGVGIRSSIPPSTYGPKSGTSMAGPHVAGLVALLMSAEGCFQENLHALEEYIEATALPRTSGQTCGGIPGSQVPNNTYGWGSIRAVLPVGEQCVQIFADGFESGDTTGWTTVVP